MRTQLRINASGDAYDREAERAAEQMTEMPNPSLRSHTSKENRPSPIQRYMDGSNRGRASAPSLVRDVLSSAGEPPDASDQCPFYLGLFYECEL